MKKLLRFGTLIFACVPRIALLASILHIAHTMAIAQPAQLSSVEVKPSQVEGGQPIEVIIRLTKKAKMWVKVNSSNNSIIPIAANTPVLLDNVSSKSIHFDTNVISGASQFVVISVNAGAVQRNANVSVKPPGALSGSGGSCSIYKIRNSELAVLFKHAKSKGWTFPPHRNLVGPSKIARSTKKQKVSACL